MTTEVPSSEQLITIHGARCQDCGEDFRQGVSRPGDDERRQDIEKEWIAGGIGHLLQKEWPRQHPAWLVREGFRCPLCGAPNLLLDLGGVR